MGKNVNLLIAAVHAATAADEMGKARAKINDAASELGLLDSSVFNRLFDASAEAECLAGRIRNQCHLLAGEYTKHE